MFLLDKHKLAEGEAISNKDKKAKDYQRIGNNPLCTTMVTGGTSINRFGPLKLQGLRFGTKGTKAISVSLLHFELNNYIFLCIRL